MNLLVLSPNLQRHLLLALVRHCKTLRTDGVPILPELSALVDVLAASNGPQRTNIDDEVHVSQPEAVSYLEAARRLGVSERTVRRMCGDGRLPVVAAGRRRLIPVAAITGLVVGEAA